ncbi:MAG: ATP-binding cassette domain-containing protein [Planctomycetaceae bacterium]
MPGAEPAPESDVGRPVESGATGTSIEIRNLTVRAGERTLLAAAACTFSAGEIVLLLGCSGVGKSVLLKILAGLIDDAHPGIQYSGEISFVAADGNRRGVSDASHPVSVVFQNFALLDELSPVQNVQIALAHAQIRHKDARSRAAELLADLRVPTDRATAVLSGGQQQRLAIARAIAPNSDVVLYDEPTSGLDARTAQQVADLIRETQQRYRRTSILVTHDYETLSRIADRIILLDHTNLRLVELPKSEWSSLPAALGTPPRAATDVIVHSWKERIRQVGLTFLTRSGILVEEILLLPFSLLPMWRSWRWGLRYTLYYTRLVAGPSACIYIAVAGMILGYVAQDFVFRYLPFRQFTEPLLTENLLNATGFSLFRFLVPILSTILIAARSGAAVSADVGSKVYGNQLDAMKTIGMNPERSLRTPILYAFLVGTPFLALLSYAVAALTAAFAFLISHQDLAIAFWDAHFHKELVQPASIFYRGSEWLLAKLVCCGLGVAMISWRCGVSPKLSGAEISQGVTRTILWATLFVLFVHFVFSLFEFKAVV